MTKWTPEEDAIIREFYPAGRPLFWIVNEIAFRVKNPRRTKNAVRVRAVQLGVTRNGIKPVAEKKAKIPKRTIHQDAAANWPERYAEISHLYKNEVADRAPSVEQLEKIRQAEQFAYALGNARGNVRIPSDPEYAAGAFRAFCAGLQLTKP